MICETDADRVTLFAKAAGELLDRGQSAESTNCCKLQQLWEVLEALLFGTKKLSTIRKGN